MKTRKKLYNIYAGNRLKSLFLLITLAAASLLFSIALVQSPHPSSNELVEKIDTFFMDKQFHGAVLIAKGDQILFSHGYGFANREYKILNAPNTVFRIGSITKQFTAIAILKLQERHLLHVSDPISKYLTDYPNGDKITIHHLLSHSSGIPSITDFSNLTDIQKHPSQPLQTLNYFKYLPLEFVPGTDCKYSDSGYIVLGAIVEVVSGKQYENYLCENLLNPLDMHATYDESRHVAIPHRALGYITGENSRQAAYIDMSFPHGAGALVSTVDDLYKWNRALLNGSFPLSKQSLDSLFTIQAFSKANTIAYGYGFMIGTQNERMEASPRSIIGHFGSIEGFEAASMFYPDDELMVILLSNQEKTNVGSFHQALEHMVHAYWRP